MNSQIATHKSLLTLTSLLFATFLSPLCAANNDSIIQGQKTFSGLCVSCHSKDLTGGIGFNLVDGEWVHGDQAPQIVQNIQNGFAKAGMPAFKDILSKQQITQVVDYILSKQQGFRNLTYKTYQLSNNNKDKSYAAMQSLPISAQGTFKNGLLNFDLPEVKNFITEASGDFYAPTEHDSYFKVQFLPPQMSVDVWIDGQKIPDTKPVWGDRAWPLKRGKQHISVRYNSTGKPKWQSNGLQFFVTNKQQTKKLFATSVQAKAYLAQSKHEVLVKKTARVQRKKVVDLPTYSIVVGLPNKLNYAFNSRSCGIVGVWKGEFLDIGPNIQGRGKDGSITIGDWVYHQPQKLQINSPQSCQFIKYTTINAPTFYYQQAGYAITVSGTAQNASALQLNYTLTPLENSAAFSKLTFTLPNSDKLKLHSPQGTLENGVWTIDASQVRQFSINLNIEAK